jgi:type IV pilus assembly protein PilV
MGNYNDNGFTLIEILIGVVIISIASLGISNLSIGIIRGDSFSRRLTTATTLAQDRMENVKRLKYQNASTLAGTENYGDILNYSEYKRITIIENDVPIGNMSTVTVKISWLYWGKEKELKLITLLAE